MLSEITGIRFDIQPLDSGWLWTTFDLLGRRLNTGRARSKREAAAFIIREIMRASFPAEIDTREAA